MNPDKKIIDHFIKSLLKELPRDTKKEIIDHTLQLSYKDHKCSLHFFKETPFDKTSGIQIPLHLIVNKLHILIAMVQSKLHYTRKVAAKDCTVRRIMAEEANAFIDRYHLMGSAKSAFYYGLFDTGELVAVASFSKGRKMDRLQQDQRSYELVRSCSKEGITITGGLTKLLNSFIKEKRPGDIMTYVNKQFGEGSSYIKCGFKKHSETKPFKFLVNKNTFQYTYYKGEELNKNEFYLNESLGNIKLVYTIEK